MKDQQQSRMLNVTSTRTNYLRPQLSSALLVTVCTFASIQPAYSALTNYTVTGTLNTNIFAQEIDGTFFSEVDLFDGSFNSLGDGLKNKAFTATFTLDDSAPISFDGGTSAAYNNAILNFSLTVDGVAAANSTSDSAFMSSTTPGQHQWSFFFAGTETPGVPVGGFDEVEIDFFGPAPGSGGGDVETSSAIFDGVEFILLDMDSGLFSESPPELAAFSNDDFDDMDDILLFELGWEGIFETLDPETGEPLDSIELDIFLQGTIGNITVGASAVPVPAAAWLFGSGLLGLAGVARRNRHKSWRLTCHGLGGKYESSA